MLFLPVDCDFCLTDIFQLSFTHDVTSLLWSVEEARIPILASTEKLCIDHDQLATAEVLKLL
jgi:hypothetical protein